MNAVPRAARISLAALLQAGAVVFATHATAADTSRDLQVLQEIIAPTTSTSARSG